MSKTLVDCFSNALSSSFGPTVSTTVAAALYVICAALACAVMRRKPSGPGAVFWRVATGILLILAIYRGLDLQNIFTSTGRCMVQEAGLYTQRRTYQADVISMIGGLCGVALVVTFWWNRHRLRHHAIAITGLVILCGFLLIRSISLHGVDRMLGRSIHGIQIGHMIEALGLGLIILNAIWLLGRRRK